MGGRETKSVRSRGMCIYTPLDTPAQHSLHHPMILTKSDVFAARVGEPLIDLIHQAEDIIPPAQLSHHFQLFLCKDLKAIMQRLYTHVRVLGETWLDVSASEGAFNVHVPHT